MLPKSPARPELLSLPACPRSCQHHILGMRRSARCRLRFGAPRGEQGRGNVPQPPQPWWLLPRGCSFSPFSLFPASPARLSGSSGMSPAPRRLQPGHAGAARQLLPVCPGRAAAPVPRAQDTVRGTGRQRCGCLGGEKGQGYMGTTLWGLSHPGFGVRDAHGATRRASWGGAAWRLAACGWAKQGSGGSSQLEGPVRVPYNPVGVLYGPVRVLHDPVGVPQGAGASVPVLPRFLLSGVADGGAGTSWVSAAVPAHTKPHPACRAAPG